MANNSIKVLWAGNPESITIPVNANETTIPSQKDEVIYLYLDEYGNFDFSEKGTDHFIMTCVAAKRPFRASHELLELRYDLLEKGLCIEKFHACEDTDKVKTKVYDTIAANQQGLTAYVVCLDKRNLPDQIKNPKDVYSWSFKLIMDEVKAKECNEKTRLAVVVTDSLPQEAKRKAVEKPIKEYMKAHFQNEGIPYSLMHHSSKCDPNLQIADYFCWALQRRIVRNRDWPFTRIKGSVKEVGFAFGE